MRVILSDSCHAGDVSLRSGLSELDGSGHGLPAVFASCVVDMSVIMRVPCMAGMELPLGVDTSIRVSQIDVISWSKCPLQWFKLIEDYGI